MSNFEIVILIYGLLWFVGLYLACIKPKFKKDKEGGVMQKVYEPKADEWCWFWDGNDMPVLSKFVHYKKLLGYVSKGEWYQKNNTGWEHCQPFIGELPTHLKEVE